MLKNKLIRNVKRLSEPEKKPESKPKENYWKQKRLNAPELRPNKML